MTSLNATWTSPAVWFIGHAPRCYRLSHHRAHCDARHDVRRGTIAIPVPASPPLADRRSPSNLGNFAGRTPARAGHVPGTTARQGGVAIVSRGLYRAGGKDPFAWPSQS